MKRSLDKMESRPPETGLRARERDRTKRAPRRAKAGWRRAYGAESVFAIASGLYAVLAILAHRYAYFEWDIELSRSVQSVRLPALKSTMLAVSALGSGWIAVAIVAVAGLALFLKGLRLEALVLTAGTASGSLIDRGLKALTARPRPSNPLVQVMVQTYLESFPSGHVQFFVEYFGFLFFLSYILIRSAPARSVSLMLLGSLIAVIGLSRVYLGAHWPSDVAGAYLFGGIWLMVMIEVYRRAKPETHSP
jgi:undecaprenyl-diphosphatase